jgi:hypothetical protein
MTTSQMKSWLIFTACPVLLVSVGCNHPKVVMPGTNIIPVKAWIVLGPSAGEQIGQDNNRGCRLTQAEIDAFRSQLIGNRKAFCPALVITWSIADQEVINDPSIPPLPFQPRRTEIALFQQNMVSQYWNNDFLNVYFCGNVEVNGNQAFGITCDPAGCQDAPYIIVNDGGFTASSGHASPITRLTFEHELAHYLLRRINVSPYDSGEHVPNNSQNILTVGLPRVMVVPTSEQSEICGRVRNGTWNLP